MYLNILIETFNVTGPIFVLVMLGLVLKRIQFFDDDFIQTSSRLVFNICLPVLLFTTISAIDLETQFDLRLFNFSILASVLTFALAWLVAVVSVHPRSDRGVVVQGAFRSNLGVVGLALCANAYGAEGLALASLLMASMTVTYNILSVFVLSYYQGDKPLPWQKVLLDIAKNPLIIAIVLAALVAVFKISLPSILLNAGGYLGQVALPLALLGTGAGLSLKAARSASVNTLLAVGLKAVLLPAVVIIIAMNYGFPSTSMGILFLLFASPTATASFIMVKSMGGNDTLASNIVMLSTLLSVLSCSLGLFLLKVFNYA